MKQSLLPVSILCASLILFCGCPAPKETSTSESMTSGTSQNHAEHSHDFGPNGGSLAVLGSHQYHAEALPDEKSGDVEIRVYSNSNKPTTLDVKELELNRTIDGKPKEYTLPAVEGGETATFKINDKELAETINDRTWEGELQVSLMLDGVPCSGNLSKKKADDHDHDHDH